MRRPFVLPLLLCSLLPPALHAQSSCSSDGRRAPVALLERFISADCEACWTDPATPAPRRGELALDWVLPGSRGEDAPLSAVATRDATDRAQGLGLPPTQTSAAQRSPVHANAARLRVAHGLPVNDYIGTSIELKAAQALRGPGDVTAWLLLVETIPAGTEGSPVARNLVRNALQVPWNVHTQLSKKEQARWFESRPMHLPDGAQAARLGVVGWVQDARGRVLVAAASHCRGR